MPAIRILALTKSTGGIAHYNKMLLSEMDPARFVSHTICLSEGAAGYAEDLAAAGLSAEPLAMARYSLDPRGDLAVFRRVRAAARAWQSSVLLCHGSKAGAIGRGVGRVTGLPVAYRQASMPFLRRVQGRRAPLYRALERGAGRLGGHVVALTDHARRETLARRLVPPSRISVIRTGIDTERFRPGGQRAREAARLGLDPDRVTVGWLGRLEPQKAPLDYVDAVAGVAQRHPEAQFVLAGDGRLAGAVRAKVEGSPLEGRIRLLSWQSDTARTLQTFDIYALSSLWEGLPLTLLEAMASGCAPISTDVDGCAEVIEDGVSGTLLPPRSVPALAEAIDALLSSPERRRRYSDAARARVVELFDRRRMIAEWETLLGSLVARPATAPGGGAAPRSRRGDG